MTKQSNRRLTTPAIPAIPDAAGRQALPAWMYRDPAEVVERIELQAIAKAKRDALRRRVHETGLSDCTVRVMRRLRIKELAKAAINGGNHGK